MASAIPLTKSTPFVAQAVGPEWCGRASRAKIVSRDRRGYAKHRSRDHECQPVRSPPVARCLALLPMSSRRRSTDTLVAGQSQATLRRHKTPVPVNWSAHPVDRISKAPLKPLASLSLAINIFDRSLHALHHLAVVAPGNDFRRCMSDVFQIGQKAPGCHQRVEFFAAHAMQLYSIVLGLVTSWLSSVRLGNRSWRFISDGR